MKTIFITGNHPRHVYLVKKFSNFFKNFKWIVEVREINKNHNILKKKARYTTSIFQILRKKKKLFKNTNKFLKKNSKKYLQFIEKNNYLKFNKIIFNEVKFQPKFIFIWLSKN